MMHHCTLCEGFYHDPVKHRYIDCPYYNGCLCGLRQQSAKHVEKCVISKEIKRKRKTVEDSNKVDEILQRREANLISNSPQFNLTCIYCFRGYSYDRKDHESRFCPYFIGCVYCGKKKVDGKHVETCKVMQEREVESAAIGKEDMAVYMICQFCRADVSMDRWDEHRKKCGPKSNLALIVDETQRKSSGPKVPTKWCWMCGKEIAEDIFSSHQTGCKERMEKQYAKSSAWHGEISIDDRRPTKSGNLKEVQFVEEP